jgi:hypothetical protein
MRFMMMMNAPAGTGDYQINDWSPEDFKAHMAFMHQFNAEIRSSGEFVLGEGLTPPRDARLVRAGKDLTPITDGPFAESKEFLAGFWIIEVESAERAYQLAAKVSSAPGPRGKPLNMGVEVRPIMSVSPTEM